MATKHMANLAIIPARGGSKRIPRKNIKPFAGKPMVAHSIEAATGSGVFDMVVVSTDDEEIAAIARGCGASVPFIRPAELSDDYTPTVPVIAHAIRALAEQGRSFECTCCIYPCAPFLQAEDLLGAREVQRATGAGYCYPVAEFPSVIQRALRRLDSGILKPLNPRYEWTRTQDCEAFYYDAGQFYWGCSDAWLQGLGLQSHGSGLVIPSWRVVDIDTLEDWNRAELIFRALQKASA